MGDTQTTTRAPLVSDDEVRTLNAARRLLEQLEERCNERGYTRTTSATTEAARYYSGRASERCESAAWHVFQVLNCLRSYGLADLTDDQVHGWGDA